MKLSLDIDLAAVRAAAKARIDPTYAARAALVSSVPAIHAAKRGAALRFTTAGIVDPALAAEADRRGLSVQALAVEILAKADDAESAVLSIEAERQQQLVRLDAATSEQEVRAVLAAHGFKV